MEKLTARAEKLNARHKRRNARFAATGAALMVVILVTIAAMRLPGFTQNKTTYCGLEEHAHTEACLNQEGGCPLEEHVHSLACYSNPQADVESQATWEQTVPTFEDGTPRLWRTVEIAKSQLGYHESSQNYIVEDGLAYGFTRFGAWVGNPYAKWNAQFVCFCLGYSGIDDVTFPRGSDADIWAEQLRATGKYVEADDPAYKPQPGDVVLLARGDAHSVAVITGVDEATGELRVIEGDLDDAVREVRFVPQGNAAQTTADTNQAEATPATTAQTQPEQPAAADQPKEAAQDGTAKTESDKQEAEKSVDSVTEAIQKAESKIADLAAKGASSATEEAKPGTANIYESAKEDATKAVKVKSHRVTKAEKAEKAEKAGKADKADNAENAEKADATAAQTTVNSKVPAVSQDDSELSKGSNLIVDEGIAQVKKIGENAQKADEKAEEKTDENAQKAEEKTGEKADDATEDSAAAEHAATTAPAASEPATGEAPAAATAANPGDPVVLGYGKMPDDLRKEYDDYKQLLAQREAEKKEEQEKQEKQDADGGIEVVEGDAQESSDGAQEAAPAKEKDADAAKESAKEAPQVLTTEADGFKVSVDLAGRAREGYRIEAKALDSTPEQLDAVEDALTEKLEGGATKRAHVNKDSIRAFDIRVLDKSGAEVEIGKSVSVTIKPLAKSVPIVEVEAAEDTIPEVLHIKDEKAEHLEAEAKDDGFEFATRSFSPFVFVYMVDFELEGRMWSMDGGAPMLLSAILNELKANVNIADVTNATFSNPQIVEVTSQEKDGKRDWQLKSLRSFTTTETLKLTLSGGSTMTVSVTDAGEESLYQTQGDGEQGEGQQEGGDNNNSDSADLSDIQRLLERVEFYDGATLVGDTSGPDTMVVRPGHEYTMRLHFSEDEDAEDPKLGQFLDEGVMRYTIPDRVHLSKRAFDENNQVKFDILLDRKHTLSGNTVTYYEAVGSQPAYIEVRWNTTDKANYKLLKASPRTSFMLSFPYTIIDAGDGTPIEFSSSAVLDVEGDPTYDVELEKTATPRADNPEIIDYVVTAVADGNVEDVLFTDVMGEALTYAYSHADGSQPSSGVQVLYKKRTGVDANGNPVYTDYAPADLPADYSNTNIGDFNVATGDHGFDFKLNKLNNSDMAVIKYSAHVDYTKLGGKNNIGTTSKNTVTARDNHDNLLDEASQALDKDIDYLQIGKQRIETEYRNALDEVISDEGHEPEEYYVANNWKYMYVKWRVIYNPDHLINVEGATLKDTIWMGKKFATTYATDRDFTVSAYESGIFTKDDGNTGDTFTSTAEEKHIIDPTEANGHGWDDVVCNDVDVTVADSVTNQLSSWEWTIPQKSITGLDDDKHYAYVVEYWTKIDKDADSGSYVGNQVTESIADITRDKSVEFPGIGPGWDVVVDKEHIVDDYDEKTGKVYTQWKITFDRRNSNLERAIVEDTLPHLKISKEESIDGVEHIYRDTFVNKKISEDPDHGWEVTGLYNTDNKKEQCVPSVSTDDYDVVFWFFKNQNEIQNPDIYTPGQGLYGYGAESDVTAEQKKITITFWTENDNEWIQDAAQGKATNEHWNHVHLVLDGKENVDNEYAVPKPRSEIKKKVEEAGSWTDGNTTLPVYRYTLSLNGLTDDAFIPVYEGDNLTGYKLVITDEFNGIMNYLRASSLPTAVDDDHHTEDLVDGKKVTLSSRNTSDEMLIRPVPKTTDEWPATFSEVEVVSNEGDGKNQVTITIPVSAEQREAMKYQVMAQDGVTPLKRTNPETNEEEEVWVYGKTYEVSYYLAPDFDKVRQKAQAMVDNKQYTNTKLTFENTATWENVNGEAGKSTFTAKTDYDLKPVKKKLLSYDSKSEVAYYSIDINPLKLTMNNGERYSVQDSYEHMAVDFQTVKFVTDPPGLENKIEWSYHNNKGTFWVPDETKVTITYEGWPVGKRSDNTLTFKNTASIGGFVDNVSGSAKLSVDHEGYASTYRVRIFKFADDNMDTPLEGAVFQLFEKAADGEIVPMEYKEEHSIPTDDDLMWQVVNKDRTGDDVFPTPENHKVGDDIYFVTGNGEPGSADKGFAEVMLSQSRDGVALKKNKQYYLREVQEPNGYIKEDIDWRFIIGDNDDWDNYVYSDDSILQISNASEERVLTVRKTFVDRTSAQLIASQYDPNQKNVQFEIVGTSLTETVNGAPKVVYNKTVTYNDFMAVDTPQDDEGTTTKREWLLIIHKLPAGNYTVREVSSSAQVEDTIVTTTVDGEGSVTRVDSEGETVNPHAEDNAHFTTGADNQTGDTLCTFTVPASDDIDMGEHTKTSVQAEFTNTYTDTDPVSLTVGKQWDNGGKDVFTPKKAEFVLYADGEKYALTKTDGAFVNDDGNIVIAAGTDSSWSGEVTIENLPRKRTVRTETNGVVTYTKSNEDIVWTVKEVGATYRTSGAKDITVEDAFLKEHFTTTVNGAAVNEGGNSFNEDNEAQFTNTFNNLTTVRVNKVWTDSIPGDEDEPVVDHADDTVFFDLYRTTVEISSDATPEQLRALVESAEFVLEETLSANDMLTYENSLLEKQNNMGEDYHYFVLERSVAGYADSYARTETAGNPGSNDGQQVVTITNTPLENEPRGNLTIQKTVTPETLGTNLNKTYKFTIWNSGKYVQDGSGTLGMEPHEFELKEGAGTLVINNLKEGAYTITEVKESAQVGGYKLASTTAVVTVDGSTTNVSFNDYEADVYVKGAATIVPTDEEDGSQGEEGGSQGEDNPQQSFVPKTTNVNVINNYEKDVEAPKVDFTFGKLWVMPNANDTTTLIWPNNTTITMQVGRRITNADGTKTVDAGFNPTYTFAKTTTNEIVVTPGATPDPWELTFDNPDVTASSAQGSGQGDTHSSSQSGTVPINYHHYIFNMKNLLKYDDNGNEYEYFAKETAVTDGTTSLLDENNTTGKYYIQQYGFVDGVGAGVVLDAGDAATANGVVGYAINRLAITQKVTVPVKKFINGWPNWGEEDSDTYKYPQFTFKLYDEFGYPITEAGEQISATTNSVGETYFTIPDSLINPNEMMWWSDEQVLYGSRSFWIKEDAVTPYDAELDPLNTNYEYNGITDFTASTRITLVVKYKWIDGTITSTANAYGYEYKKDGVESAVINNTYDPGETPITVTKTWDDNSNQDGYRRTVRFKVHGKYYVGNGKGDEGDNKEYQSLDKVWFVKNVKVGSTQKKERDEIILNGTTEDEKANEYRITLDPRKNETTKTVMLPAYYEGHKIIYSVTEELDESEITTGIKLSDKYTKTATLSGDESTVTNTHEPEKVNLSVEKLWVGDDPQKDSCTVTVRLKASYNGYEITYDNIRDNSPWKAYKELFTDRFLAKAQGEDGKWLASWNGLPRFAPGTEGKEVTYSVEEVEDTIPTGYYMSSNVKGILTKVANQAGTYALPVTITNTYESVNIPVKKIWDDDSNRDGLRNENTKVTFTLSATVGNSSTNIINNLRDKSGVSIAATITLGQADALKSGGTTNYNTWVKDGWQNLPKYYQGQEVVYRVTENVSDWSGSFEDANRTYETDSPKSSNSCSVDKVGTITNSHKLYNTQITLTKTWDDDNNRDGKRPDPVTFVRDFLELKGNLLVNDADVTLTLGDEKTRTEEQLANQYVYTLKNGDSVIKDAEVVITGNNEPHTSDVQGDLDTYNTYTVVFTVPRYRNDTESRNEVVYKLAESSIAGYERVAVEDGTEVPQDGKIEITYGNGSIGENDTKTGTAAAKNEYVPEHINIRVTKSWEHGSNGSNNDTPTSATVQLVATIYDKESESFVEIPSEQMAAWSHNGKLYDIEPEQTLDNENSYTGEWENLPAHLPGGVGETITYKIKELDAPDYYHLEADTVCATDSATETSGDKNWHVITATNVYEKTTVTATKTWDDGNNQDGKRKPVAFKLMRRVGETGTEELVPDAADKSIAVNNSSPAVWENLPAWIDDQRVYYWVEEVAAPGEPEEQTPSLAEYLVGYDAPVVSGFSYPSEKPEKDSNGDVVYNVSGTVTNKYVPESTDLTFTKVWDHKGVPFNSDGLDNNDPRIPANLINRLHLYVRVKTTDETSSQLIEVEGDKWNPPLVEGNNWKALTTIDDDYHITITGLPKFAPKSSDENPTKELEYFISEDDNDLANYSMASGVVIDGKRYVQLCGGESSSPIVLENTRDTAKLKICKSVVSDLAVDHSTPFTFTVRTNPPINSAGVPSITYAYKVYNSSNIEQGSGVLGFTDGNSGTITLTDGQYIVIEGLPVGVTYTVTEATNNDFTSTCEPPVSSQTEGDETGIVSATGSQTLAEKDVTKQVAFTNTRKTGELSVTKTVSSLVKNDKSKNFTFQVELSDLDTTSSTKTYDEVTFTKVGETGTFVGTFVLQHGQTKTFHNLPTGATYRVVELSADTTSTEYYESGYTLTGSSGTTGTIGSTPGTAAFSNVRNVGNLTISKTLTNAIPVDDGDTFYFDIQLKDDGGSVLVLDLTNGVPIKVGKTTIASAVSANKPYYDEEHKIIKNVPVKLGVGTTITGLPLGAKCEVTETHFAVSDASMDVDNIEMGGTSSQEVMLNDSANAVSFNNTRKTGGLKLKKVVDSPVDVEHGSTYTVRVTLRTEFRSRLVQNLASPATLVWSKEGNSSEKTEPRNFENGYEDIVVKDGETVTISGIPTDVTYTITEPGYDDFDKTFKIDSSGTLKDTQKQSASAEVKAEDENTYTTEITNKRQLGNLTVGKTVASSVASDDNKEFSFTVVVADPNDTDAKIGANQYGTSNNSMVFDTNNTAEFTLKHGETKVAEGLPAGWTYTVTESAVRGSNNISDDFVTTWTRTVGEDTADPVTGTVIDSSSSDGEISIVSVSEAPGGSINNFTNTRKTGELEIKKTLENSIPDDKGDTFYFDVELKFGSDSEILARDDLAPIKVGSTTVVFASSAPSGEHPLYYDTTTGKLMNVPVTLSAQSSGSTKITGLPIGTTYTVAENTSAMPSTNITRKEGDANPAGRIEAKSEAPVTNVRALGNGVSISKTVGDDLVAEDKDPNTLYKVRVSLKTQSDAIVGGVAAKLQRSMGGSQQDITFDSNGIYDLDIHHDETITITGIPTDVICSIQEIDERGWYNQTYKVNDVEGSSTKIVQNSIPAMKVTNTRKLGSLTVDKSVVSAFAPDKQYAFKFKVTIVDSNLKDGTYGGMQFANNEAQFTLVNGSSPVIATGLPVGVNYVVTEYAEGDTETAYLGNFDTTWTKTVNSTMPVTVGGSGLECSSSDSSSNAVLSDPSTVAFTNTREAGKLKLEKVVESPFNSELNCPYTFTVELKMPSESQDQLSDPSDVVAVDKDGNNVDITKSLNETTHELTLKVPVHKGNPVTISNLPVGVTYTVTEDAFERIGEFNTAYTYKGVENSETSVSEDPTTTHTVKTKDTTYVTEVKNSRKTVPVKIRKVSAFNNDEGLEGAEFSLTLTGEVGDVTQNWIDVPLKSTSSSNGYLTGTIGGEETSEFYLPVGTYTLTETKAPLGYNKLAQPATIVVEPNQVTYTDSIMGHDQSVVLDQNQNIVYVNVANSTGAELPSTGGLGMLPTYMLGVLLFACFLILCVV